jgi:hypothetical protein
MPYPNSLQLNGSLSKCDVSGGACTYLVGRRWGPGTGQEWPRVVAGPRGRRRPLANPTRRCAAVTGRAASWRRILTANEPAAIRALGRADVCNAMAAKHTACGPPTDVSAAAC